MENFLIYMCEVDNSDLKGMGGIGYFKVIFIFL